MGRILIKILASTQSPEVFAGWAETSEREKGHITRMNNFFCGLHFMVGLADCAEATVKLWEESHELQVNKYSGTQVLIRPTYM